MPQLGSVIITLLTIKQIYLTTCILKFNSHLKQGIASLRTQYKMLNTYTETNEIIDIKITSLQFLDSICMQ